jgi:hypothetical protein
MSMINGAKPTLPIGVRSGTHLQEPAPDKGKKDPEPTPISTDSRPRQDQEAGLSGIQEKQIQADWHAQEIRNRVKFGEMEQCQRDVYLALEDAPNLSDETLSRKLSHLYRAKYLEKMSAAEYCDILRQCYSGKESTGRSKSVFEVVTQLARTDIAQQGLLEGHQPNKI